jgi:biopolymer transport protein ExbB/TolQ
MEPNMQFSVIELWQSTGPVARSVVIVLTVLSIISIAVGVERLLSLGRATRLSRRFLESWRATKGAHRSRAVDVAPGEYDGAPAAILLHALGAILDSGVDHASEQSAYDRTMRRVLLAHGQNFRRGLGVLATIGSTAPFIGLFGTVAGIVNAFRQMAISGQGGLGTVSAGIAEALITTALGILVAIPALWLFNAVTARVGALLTELECAAEELAVDGLTSASETRRSPAAASGPVAPVGGVRPQLVATHSKHGADRP